MTACGEEEGAPELEFPGVCTSPAPALYKGGSSGGAATRPPASQGFGRDPPPIQHPSPCSCALLMGWLAALALLWTLVPCRGLRRPVPHPHVPCYSAGDLRDGEAPAPLLGRSLRWDHYVPVQLVPQLERLQDSPGHRRHRRHGEHACPALQLRTGLHSEPHERSISPWRYRIDEDEDRYPRKLAFAECLCSGCVDVKTGRETTSLNSVPIYQTMMVLRRKPCPRPASPGLVTFEVDYIRVPVGCTCVLPRTGR